MRGKKTEINNVQVEYWFNHKKEARLTLKWIENEVTFLGEKHIKALEEFLSRRRVHMNP